MIGPIRGSNPPPDSNPTRSTHLGIQTAAEIQQKFAAIFEKVGTQEDPVSFEEKANELVSLLEKLCPEEAAKLRSLITEHKEYLNQLSADGWKGVKKRYKSGMGKDANGYSMEQFRGETVQAVSDLCLAAMKKMGYNPPGKFSATGTPGWDSDIDTVFLPPAGMPEKVQIMGKLLFDTIFIQQFQCSSGYLFDTECYLRQAAIGYATESWVSSSQGKAEFANLELHAALYQMLIQYGSVSHPEWQEFKIHTLANASSSLRGPLMEAFETVELLERSMEKNLKIQIIRDSGQKVPIDDQEIDSLVAKIKKANPSAELHAKMNFKIEVLMKIAEEIDACKSRIDTLTKQAHTLKHPSSETLQRINREIELLNLKIGTLALMRERFFDEGYISQGAFTKVCFVEEGQIHQSKIREFRTTLKRSRRENVPVHELFASKEAKKFELGEAQKRKSNNQQNVASALENLAMYKGHFEHALNHNKDNVQNHQKALISQSKYSERTLGALYSVLKEIRKNPQSSKQQYELAEQLGNKLKKAYFRASELEMTKRKTQLNITTAKSLLVDAIQLKNPELTKENIENDVDTILNRQQLGNPLYDLRHEETLLPEDIYLSQISAMDQLGLVIVIGSDSQGNLMTDNPLIDAIVHARCGLATSDQHTQRLIEQIHEMGEQLTLQNCGFNSIQDIDDFNQEVEDLTLQVYNLAVSEGVVETPSQSQDPSCNFLKLWDHIAPGTKAKSS